MANPRLRRTDLFLVRVWSEANGRDYRDGGESEGESGRNWCGKVQRVVDGETHQFDDWQGLTGLLRVMLSGKDGAGSSDTGRAPQ